MGGEYSASMGHRIVGGPSSAISTLSTDCPWMKRRPPFDAFFHESELAIQLDGGHV